MLGAYASVAVLCAVSLVIGQAVLSLCGRRELTWLSGPVGLATILVASGIAIKLPGHGTAVAITVAVLSFLALATLLGRRARGAHPALGLTAAALAVLLASVPFIANGRVGVLGVGLVNDDMANHLLIADWLNTRVGQMPALIHQGYPVGPHALAAGLSEGLGTGVIQAFAGLTVAIPALTALVAFEALGDLRRATRVVAAALVAVPYLAAAYLAQEAFKEPIEALFVLSFALLLPRATSPVRAVPLGVIAAGAVYTYSFPGLFWLAGTAVIWGLIRWWSGRVRRAAADAGEGGAGAGPATSSGTSATSRRRDIPRGRRVGYRRPLLAVASALIVLLVLTAPEWGRMIDFTHFRAFKSATISGGVGNLRHQVSPLEALGIWPASDFRLSASEASGPAAAFYLGALVAAVALAVALPRWVRRNGLAIPCALLASVVIYLGALVFGTVYTSAKALAILAPLVTLISFGGLLSEGVPASTPLKREPRRGRMRRLRLTSFRGPDTDTPVIRALLAAMLAAGIVLSSLLVLRQAPVAPTSHADQLAELRPLVQGRRVLFLGRDNFVAYELRGARPFTAVRNYYDPNYVKPDLRVADVFQKFDFDSVRISALRRFRFVITTRAAFASGPPPGFRPLRETPDFVLWRRTGPLGPRDLLAEGANPGAILDCERGRGRELAREGGKATVFARRPVAGGSWSPSSTVESGSTSTQSLTLPPGRWEISVAYDATRQVRVTAPGLDAALPANLDYRGSVPFYPVGELPVRRGGPVRFTVTVERPPLAGRLLGTKSEAHLGALAASPAAPSGGPIPGEAERQVPLRHACSRYVDWFRPPAAG